LIKEWIDYIYEMMKIALANWYSQMASWYLYKSRMYSQKIDKLMKFADFSKEELATAWQEYKMDPQHYAINEEELWLIVLANFDLSILPPDAQIALRGLISKPRDLQNSLKYMPGSVVLYTTVADVKKVVTGVKNEVE